MFNQPMLTGRRRKPVEPPSRKQIAMIAMFSQDGTDRQQAICIALNRYRAAGGELSSGRCRAVIEACSNRHRMGGFVNMLLEHHGSKARGAAS